MNRESFYIWAKSVINTLWTQTAVCYNQCSSYTYLAPMRSGYSINGNSSNFLWSQMKIWTGKLRHKVLTKLLGSGERPDCDAFYWACSWKWTSFSWGSCSNLICGLFRIHFTYLWFEKCHFTHLRFFLFVFCCLPLLKLRINKYFQSLLYLSPSKTRKT